MAPPSVVIQSEMRPEIMSVTAWLNDVYGTCWTLHAGKVAEQRGREMTARADAERSIVQLARMRPGVVDQFLDGAERRVGRHHEDVLRGRDPHDGLEVLDRIETLHRRERDVDRQHLSAEVKRIAVSRRLRRRRRTDIAAGAGTILHEHRLAPGLAQLLRDDTAERIDGAPGSECDDDADGSVGIGLRRCARRCLDKCRPKRRRDPCRGHTSVPHAIFLHSALHQRSVLCRPSVQAYSTAAQSAAVLAPRIGRQNVEEIGAGEGIRTLDPDLGKVVLYP